MGASGWVILSFRPSVLGYLQLDREDAFISEDHPGEVTSVNFSC